MSENLSSFRRFLQESLVEITQAFRCFDFKLDLLSEMVLLLTNYQEEGISLFPVIFISDSKDKIMNDLEGKEAIHIGRGLANRETLAQAFKNCAPLAEDRLWAVYLVIEPETISYGIFRSDPSPLAPTVFERLRQLQSTRGCIVGLTRLGGSFVEIRTNTGEYRYVNVSGASDDDYHPAQVIRAFVDGVSADVDASIKPLLQSFYYRLGMDVLHGPHGSLIAIQKKGESIPSFLEDGIHLRPQVGVADAIAAIRIDPQNREPYLRLLSYGQLLRKLTWMDGITVLDTEGSILAYNCFVRTSVPETQSRILGGARRRAFEVLQRFVPNQLTGAFYKSQDGTIRFKANPCS